MQIKNYVASKAHWGYHSICDKCIENPKQKFFLKKRGIADPPLQLDGYPHSLTCDICGYRIKILHTPKTTDEMNNYEFEE